MKNRYLLIVILTIQHLSVFSQTFEVKDSLQLKVDHIIDGQWVDINNDGLLNYVALLKKTDSVELGYFSIKNDSINYKKLFSKKCLEAQFEMADFTRDGLSDILLSIKNVDKNSLNIYKNNDVLDFEEDVLEVDSIYANKLLSMDLNRQGSREILAITDDMEPKLYTYKIKDMKWDTLSVAFSKETAYQELLNVDLDKDGWDDILIAGLTTDNEPILEFYKNSNGNFKKATHDFDYQKILKMSRADLDADGDFEVIYYGNTSSSQSLYYYGNNNNTFTKEGFGIDPDNVNQFFAADFNSDGFIDIVLKSTISDNVKNVLMLNDGHMNFNSEEITLADHQDFGDWDWDGDLDIIQFGKDKDSVKVFLVKNSTIDDNTGPSNPTQSFVFPQGKKVTISWDSVLDDHTNQAAITYDLYIRKEEVTVSPGFDIDRTHRIVVAHGNQNTLTTASYYHLESGVYEYGVQTVDNAFFAGGEGAESDSGNGSGGGIDILRGQFVICDSVRTHQYIICKQEEVILVAESSEKGTWYSARQGYLGVTDSLKLVINETDEIYFSVQQSTVCEDQEAWLFNVQDSGNIDLLPDVWACVGQRLEFEVGDFWKSIQWESSIKGGLGNTDHIEYVVDQADIISTSLTSNQGCVFEDTFSINVSTPEITLNGEVFRILKGGSIQLTASGGTNYEWSPIEGLNNPLIFNPVASPEKTTIYTVEVTDSLECATTGTIQIIVESNAFIPNLFTPNQDQRNDVLKIYALEEVSDFTFKIYNRSGSLVYESSDVNEVVNLGWDGTKNGREQPNGVYYWKISGTYRNGKTVYLNGESSGAVHLLR